MREIIFEIKNLSVDIKKTNIINDITLNVKENQIVGLLGPNGAGKTTTIKTCAGLIRKKAGTISCCNYNIDKDYEKYLSYISFGFDKANYYGELTGYENLKLFSRLYNGCNNNKIIDTVELVGLSKRINDKVSTYSFGMKQRLNFARALLQNSKLIILDEPLNGIDPQGVAEFRNLILSIRNNLGCSFIISSHLLSELEHISDRLVFFKRGKIVDDILLNNTNYLNHYIITAQAQSAATLLNSNNFEATLYNENTIRICGEDIILNDCLKVLYNSNIPFTNVESKRNIEELYLQKVRGTGIE